MKKSTIIFILATVVLPTCLIFDGTILVPILGSISLTLFVIGMLLTTKEYNVDCQIEIQRLTAEQKNIHMLGDEELVSRFVDERNKILKECIVYEMATRYVAILTKEKNEKN